MRCFGDEHPLYAEYHDNEWGHPVYDDIRLFEFLILEGAQAGLSWLTILKRREGYRQAFFHFDPARVARMTDQELDFQITHGNIIKNRLKVYATRKNAQVFLKIQEEFGSFSKYLWAFVQNKPLKNTANILKDLPVSSPESDALSKDLKRRGMSFVGTKIMQAYMQAVGLIDAHLTTCISYKP